MGSSSDKKESGEYSEIPLDDCDPILLAIGRGMHEELEKEFLDGATSLTFSATHALETAGAVFCPQSVVSRSGIYAVATYDANAIKIWYLYKGEQVVGSVQYNNPNAVEELIRQIYKCLEHVRGLLRDGEL